MTYKNCLKYKEEATEEATAKFWADRIKRKYPNQVVEVEEEVKPKKKGKK